MANVMALLGVEASEEHKAVLRGLGNGECIFRDLDGRVGRIGIDLISDQVRQWLDTNPTRARPAEDPVHRMAPRPRAPGYSARRRRVSPPGDRRSLHAPPSLSPQASGAHDGHSPQPGRPVARSALALPGVLIAVVVAGLLGSPAIAQAAVGATGTHAATAQHAARPSPVTPLSRPSETAASTPRDKAGPSGICSAPGIGDIGGLLGFCNAGSSGLIGDLNNICQPSVPAPEPARRRHRFADPPARDRRKTACHSL